METTELHPHKRMVEALAALPVPPVSFQFNNRKLIQGFYRGLGISNVTTAIRMIDKLDKLPAATRETLKLAEMQLTPDVVAEMRRVLSSSGAGPA